MSASAFMESFGTEEEDDSSMSAPLDDYGLPSDLFEDSTFIDTPEDFDGFHGPILPSPVEIQGFILRDWRRQNAIELEEKERQEKEFANQTRTEAGEYKIDFQQRRKIYCETNMANNREKEKLFLANQEKFHGEADKNYWKAIGEIIPHELPTMEKKKGKKTSIVVIQGPKPGKPTDLSRMRQILVKLKHSSPPHMKPSSPAKDPEDVANLSPQAVSVA